MQVAQCLRQPFAKPVTSSIAAWKSLIPGTGTDVLSVDPGGLAYLTSAGQVYIVKYHVNSPGLISWLMPGAFQTLVDETGCAVTRPLRHNAPRQSLVLNV